MDSIVMYLAGNIQKGHERESLLFWAQDDIDHLRRGLSPATVVFLNPADRSDDLSDQRSVFGRDMTQVFCSDLVFVDARERRGLGVGAEMMWAKLNAVPVITLAPKKTHYRRESVQLLGKMVEEWTHPFVESLSDVLVESIEEGIAWIRDHFSDPKAETKSLDDVASTMEYYLQTHFQKDRPMRDLAKRHELLQSRLEEISALSAPELTGA